uniref:Si:dkey-118j18.2 n=1 Tax=Erpetoichthys calabaricus TaxID=27687 RepID=A0A8C4RUK3_ERPCA
MELYWYIIVIISLIIKIFFYICWYRSRQRQMDAYLSNPRNAQIVIVGGRAYLHQLCERQSANWPSWYGIQDDSSIGEAAGSLPPAPSYSHLDVPPPYEVVTGDDLKPPPYSEYALGEAATDLQETCDNCSISDAPPPYTPFPLTEIHLHTEATCNSEALENNSVPTTSAQD